MLVYERKSKKKIRVVEGEKDGKEVVSTLDFRSVEKYVPEWISS